MQKLTAAATYGGEEEFTILNIGAILANFHIDVPGPALLSSITQNSSAKIPASSPTPPPFSPFSGFMSPPPGSQSNTPQPSLTQQSTFPKPPQKTTPANDPFAALGTPQFSSKPATPKPAAPAAAAEEDDEWSFSSALPESTYSKKHNVTVKDSGPLVIHLQAERSPNAPSGLFLRFLFSNTTSTVLSDLHFQIAVTKVRASCSHISSPVFFSSFSSNMTLT